MTARVPNRIAAMHPSPTGATQRAHCVCMHAFVHSHAHKVIAASGKRDRLNRQRHMVVQATATTMLR